MSEPTGGDAGNGPESLALKADGTVAVWGKYYTGTTYNPATTPAGLANLQAIAAGSDHDLGFFGNGSPAPELRLGNLSWAGGRFSFSVSTQNGQVYRLEFMDSLADSAWNILPLVAGNGRNQVLTDSTSAGPQRFYRVSRW